MKKIEEIADQIHGVYNWTKKEEILREWIMDVLKNVQKKLPKTEETT